MIDATEQKSHCIITVGVSGSGKTTFAEQKERDEFYHIVCRDDIRADIVMERRNKPFTSFKQWNTAWEKQVTKRWRELIDENVELKRNFIIADTNLNKDAVFGIRNQLIDKGYQVDIKIFDVDIETAIERDANRVRSVGAFVIGKQYEKFINNWLEPEKQPQHKNKAIIVDIDGTIAHMGDKRKPYEWDKVHLDEVDYVMKHVVNSFANEGVTIIFVSGRDAVCRTATEEWLDKHFHLNFSNELVYMRGEGDMRDDRVVKSEIYNNNIRGKYNVLAVFDDRPKVCNMWRRYGLKVIQVANPLINF